MLSLQDRAEVMKLIAEAKREIYRAMWSDSNINHTDKECIKSDVSDNTEAILELSELIPSEE